MQSSSKGVESPRKTPKHEKVEQRKKFLCVTMQSTSNAFEKRGHLYCRPLSSLLNADVCMCFVNVYLNISYVCDVFALAYVRVQYLFVCVWWHVVGVIHMFLCRVWLFVCVLVSFSVCVCVCVGVCLSLAWQSVLNQKVDSNQLLLLSINSLPTPTSLGKRTTNISLSYLFW